VFNVTSNGTASAAGSLNVGGTIYSGGREVIDANGGWHRSYGATGWYNGTYGGGWYMEDSTWVRAYNAKSVYTPNQMRADAGFCIGGSCMTSWQGMLCGLANNSGLYALCLGHNPAASCPAGFTRIVVGMTGTSGANYTYHCVKD
jgi:hypothetical protein